MLTNQDRNKLRYFGYVYNRFAIDNQGVPVEIIAAEMMCHPRTVQRWFKKGELGERLQANFVLFNNELVYRRRNHMTELTKEALLDISKRKINTIHYQNLKAFRDGYNQLIDCNAPLPQRYVSVDAMAAYIKVTPRTVRRWFDHGNRMREYLIKEYYCFGTCIFSQDDYKKFIAENY